MRIFQHLRNIQWLRLLLVASLAAAVTHVVMAVWERWIW